VRNERGEIERDASGLPFTTLGYASGPGQTGASDQQPAGPRHYPHWPKRVDPAPSARPDLSNTDTAHPDYLQEAAVPLTSGFHGGEDVPAYADGAGAERFRGVLEQEQIYYIMADASGWDRDP
jgi:alkaline phosphatase